MRVQRIRPAEDADLPLPEYKSAQASGMDVAAALDAPLTLAPGDRAAVPTGLALEVPRGFEVQVRPRSGLALERGLTVANAPGTIDADYRGEVRVIVVNLGREAVTIGRGDRIAQLVVSPVARARLQLVEALPQTARGGGGFGSTGIGAAGQATGEEEA